MRPRPPSFTSIERSPELAERPSYGGMPRTRRGGRMASPLSRMRCLQRDSVERDGAPVRIRRVAAEVDKMAQETPNESACAGDMNTAPGAQPREARTGVDQTLRESEAHWREVFEH